MSCWKPRAIRNDAVSSISDMATCATTSILRPHKRLRPGTSTSADFSAFTRSTRVLWSAGARPQRSAHSTDNATHASSTRLSIWNGTAFGKSVIKTMLSLLWNHSMTPYPIATPANPPRVASIRLSVNSSRISRSLPAPSANRTAISRALARARLRRSPATLVQATSRTASARITNTTPNFQFSSSIVRAWNWV